LWRELLARLFNQKSSNGLIGVFYIESARPRVREHIGCSKKQSSTPHHTLLKAEQSR
jgi:hypothetical protein